MFRPVIGLKANPEPTEHGPGNEQSNEHPE
jgi:hypothetical protein